LAFGERRGGVGLVEEPGHPYDGKWAVFSIREVGNFNFTSSPGTFNLSLHAAKPADSGEGWPVFANDDHDAGGYAEIVA